MKFSAPVLSALAFLSASVGAQDTPATIVDIVTGSDDHTTLAAAVTAAGYVDLLQEEGPYTLFAPTDAAFAALNETTGGYLATLLTEPFLPHLQDILQYHVVAGAAVTSDMLEEGPVETFSGDNITVSLMGGVMINEATVTTPDLEAGNGVVHVLDGVLVPEWTGTTILDQGEDNELFSVLVDLVNTAGLGDTLSGPGPLTLFAPTNDAFTAALTDLNTTLDDLKADTELLTSILTYHVVSGVTTSDMLEDGMEVTTVNGATATIAMEGDGFTIAGAPIVDPDYLANNGIVHVVGAVMVPPTSSETPAPSPTEAPADDTPSSAVASSAMMAAVSVAVAALMV